MIVARGPLRCWQAVLGYGVRRCRGRTWLASAKPRMTASSGRPRRCREGGREGWRDEGGGSTITTKHIYRTCMHMRTHVRQLQRGEIDRGHAIGVVCGTWGAGGDGASALAHGLKFGAATWLLGAGCDIVACPLLHAPTGDGTAVHARWASAHSSVDNAEPRRFSPSPPTAPVPPRSWQPPAQRLRP